MRVRAIVWEDAAIDKFLDVFLWYKQECGVAFAQKFYAGIQKTIRTLSMMPTIGILEYKASKFGVPLYSFLAHPKYRIIYFYDDTTITIVGIRAMRQG